MTDLVLLCDGTNNNLTGGRADTHVVLLAELLRRSDPAQRRVFYDPGVGNVGQTPTATWGEKLKEQYRRLEGLALGRGVFDNIAEGYLFLMHHWQGPQDRLWLFGFSRGAFTARSIAGLVNRFGILPAHQASLVPTLLHRYFARQADEDDKERRGQIDLQDTQVHRLLMDGRARRPVIHFVGVWDTVASVGIWPLGLRITARPILKGKRFVHVRQALALDEQRAQFKPRNYQQANDHFALAPDSEQALGDIRQLWFRGAHCDVGGGYEPARQALARRPFEWLVSQAVECGLELNIQGRRLDNEAAVRAEVQALLPTVMGHAEADVALKATPEIHAEPYDSPIWAVTGLRVRTPGRVELDGVKDPVIRAEAHASVAEWTAPWPRGTVWSGRRSKWTWLASLLAMALLWALHGWLVGLPAGTAVPLDPAMGVPWLPESAGSCLAQGCGGWQALEAHNARFVLWQLTAPFNPSWLQDAATFRAPGWALFWDLGLIAAYAYWLSRWVTRAFARLAGLRHAASVPRPWLNRLGLALPLMVLADVAENLLTALALLVGPAAAEGLAPALNGSVRSLLMAASALKIVGFGGVLALLAWSGWKAGFGRGSA